MDHELSQALMPTVARVGHEHDQVVSKRGHAGRDLVFIDTVPDLVVLVEGLHVDLVADEGVEGLVVVQVKVGGPCGRMTEGFVQAEEDLFRGQA